jgi:uncharacterized membrane protein YkvA (DUF1232 family)
MLLKKNLDDCEVPYPDYINNFPKIFKLLLDLLKYPEITKKERLLISAAVTYAVLPNDFIPEKNLGPYGYVDDIFVCVYVLKKIEEIRGLKLLEKVWEGDNSFVDILELSESKSKDFLTSKDSNIVKKILKFVGLID